MNDKHKRIRRASFGATHHDPRLNGPAFKKPNRAFRNDREIADWVAGLLRRIDPIAQGKDADGRLLGFLAASSVVGPDSRRIAAMLSLPLNLTELWADNLRRNGLWQNGEVCNDHWFDKRSGRVGLILDSFVASGLARRTLNNSGQAEYEAIAGERWWEGN